MSHNLLQTPEGTLNYTYDAAGNLASMASSDGNVSVSYTWDSLNRLSTVTDNRLTGTSNTTTYTYDTANNVVKVAYPNGVQATLNYDPLNRLTSLTTPNTGYLYQLGPTGNRTNVTELTGRSINWSYDGIYRLTGEAISNAPSKVNGSVTYGLDPVGNRTSATSTIAGINSGALSFNPDDQELIESYDADGNTTATGGKSFAYDSEDRLKSMNGGAVTITYDGDGNRVQKIANGVVTRYLVDDLNPTGYPQVVEETGSAPRTYTYGLQRIDENQIINGVQTPSFYGYDGMGSVRQLTNSAGAITDTYEYDAFGNKIASTGTTPNNYLYRGEQLDLDLSLYYLRARYYNPLTGRFMSRDLVDGITTDPTTLHKYLYAGGDPINYKDPSGEARTATAGGGALDEYATVILAISLQAVPAVRSAESSLVCLLTSDASHFIADVENGIFYSNTGDVTPDGDCTWKVDHDCTPYEEAIQKAMRQVRNRLRALQLDENSLFCDAYDTPVPGKKGTWLGHLQQFRDRQAQLRRAIQNAEAAHCPVPPGAEELADMPPPLCPGGKIPRP